MSDSADISTAAFYLAVAAIIIAMMHYGYSSDGCDIVKDEPAQIDAGQ